MSQSQKFESAKIAENPDGSKTITAMLSPEAGAKFYRACNLISEELGRPISKAEALDYILQNYIDDFEAESK